MSEEPGASGREPEVDEAFAFFGENISAYTDLVGELRDDELGLSMSIEELSIETPIELDVVVGEDGRVRLGCAPPLYPIETSVEPVLHQLSFRAVVHHDARPPAAEADR